MEAKKENQNINKTSKLLFGVENVETSSTKEKLLHAHVVLVEILESLDPESRIQDRFGFLILGLEFGFGIWDWVDSSSCSFFRNISCLSAAVTFSIETA